MEQAFILVISWLTSGCFIFAVCHQLKSSFTEPSWYKSKSFIEFHIFGDNFFFFLQEAAYESASSPSQGIFNKLVTATEEKPWLWAVYVLSVLIPVIIIAVVCFGRKSRPVTPGYKKSDEVSSKFLSFFGLKAVAVLCAILVVELSIVCDIGGRIVSEQA